jgi:hypothetical protein
LKASNILNLDASYMDSTRETRRITTKETGVVGMTMIYSINNYYSEQLQPSSNEESTMLVM